MKVEGQKVEKSENAEIQAFAIVGVGCRFPGGIDSLDKLWSTLSDGCDVVTQIPDDRFDIRRFWHEDREMPGHACTFKAGVVGDVSRFDAAFFNMSAKEARMLDPQQRLILEMAWEAFEDAGIRPSSMAGSKTAVYIGAASTDMGMLHTDDMCLTNPYTMTGTSLSIIANRVSYFFDLHGPSMTIDTACSSSLVALHEACRAIAHDRLPMAVVGGVNILLSPMPFVGFSKAHMLSEDGRCKVFDESGNGYVRSEGGAVMLIKPLDAAQQAGDRIYAVIRATGVNSDGRTKGIALPNGEAQEALLREVYSRPGIDKKALAYVEAHGTGTAVGDPIETKSIGRALGRLDGDPLLIGSVKGNLGHLETGSGMAGLSKALLVLEKDKVPANINLEVPNPAIDFEGLGIRFTRDLIALPSVTQKKTLVGVNSFGFGGTNAHVVLEKAQPQKPAGEALEAASLLPLMISAKSENALKDLARWYAEAISSTTPGEYNRLVSAAALQRESLPYRLVISAPDIDAVREELLAFVEKGEVSNPARAAFHRTHIQHARTAFVYSGNGSQWAGMGRELYRSQPEFRASIERLDTYFAPLSGWKIQDVLCRDDEAWDLEHTEFAQPLLFAMQVAMTDLLRRRGILAQGVVGHSVGEVAAAWSAGILTLKDAVRVIYERSAVQAAMYGSGAMAAVKLARSSLDEIIKTCPSVEIAGFNAPDNFTVSGDDAAVSGMRDAVKAQGGLFKKLPIRYAFHSSRMAPLETPLLEKLQNIRPAEGEVEFYSTVTGQCLAGTALTARYWWGNVREPVNFEAALKTMLREGYTHFIEVGPHAIMLGYLRAVAKAEAGEIEPVALMRRGDAAHALEANLMKAMASGTSLDRLWPVVSRVSELPRYPWNRKRYWVEPSAETYGLYAGGSSQGLLGYEVKHARSTWENHLSVTYQPWLAGHVVDDTVLFPAAGFLEVARAAAEVFSEKASSFEMRNLLIERPLALEGTQIKAIKTTVGSRGELQLFGRDYASGEAWMRHLSGRIEAASSRDGRAFDVRSLGDWRALDTEGLYRFADDVGLRYTGAFRPVKKAWRKDNRIVVELCCDDDNAKAGYGLSPALVDGALQGLFFFLEENAGKAAYLPTWFGHSTFWHRGVPVWACIELHSANERALAASFELFDENGCALARLEDVRFLRVRKNTREERPSLYAETWLNLVHREAYHAEDALKTLTRIRADIRRHGASHTVTTEYAKLLELLVVAYAYEAFAQKNVWVATELLFGACATEEGTAYSEFLVRLLADYGLAELDDGMVRFVETDELPASSVLYRTILARYPAMWPDLVLGGYIAEHLKDFVLGEKSFEEEMPRESHPLWQKRLQTPLESEQVHLLAAFVNTLWREAQARGENLKLGLIVESLADTALAVVRALPSSIDVTVVTLDMSVKARVEFAFKDVLNVRVLAGGSNAEDLSKAGLFDILVDLKSLSFGRNLAVSLKNCREALRTGGLFVAWEMLYGTWENYLRGLHHGWWNVKTERLLSPLLSLDGWKKALTTAGYVEVLSTNETQGVAERLFIATNEMAAVSQTETPARVEKIVLLANPADSDQSRLAEELQSRLRAGGVAVETTDVCAVPASGTRVVSLFECFGGEEAAPQKTLELCQTLAGGEGKGDLIVLTDGASHAHALGVTGFLRSARNEVLNLNIAVALLEDLSDETLGKVCRWLSEAGEKTGERLFSREETSVARVIRVENPRENRAEGEKILSFELPGKLDRLVWKPLTVEALKAHEVRIAVKATGLNFRDVMWAMGMLPEEALENGFSGPTMGLECSGIVTAVGKDVVNCRPGDAVVAFAPACFSTTVTTNDNALLPKPDGMSFEEAASVPVAFFTAWYAITYLGRARRGESILIHGCAGGVGMAALQIAKLLGLEVFATAGTPAKRSLLRALGVEHVYSSRTLEFADHIRKDTAGRGVDLVLNSLAGDGAEKSLSILAPFGRFLELGKRDFYADSPMFLRPFRRNLSYFGIDVDQMLVDCPNLAAELFREVMTHFEKGDFRALPIQIFEADRVTAAFQTMQASTHIGKIVLSYGKRDVNETDEERENPSLKIREDRTYLLTGAMGGLGRQVAGRLVKDGAKHLLLVTRRAPEAKDRAWLASLEKEGVKVAVLIKDVASRDFVTAAQAMLDDLPPLAGIVHTAGVIDDRAMSNLDAKALDVCWTPKVLGGLNLEALLRIRPEKPDFVVFFSSATVLMGNPGQANYVAANMAQEAIVRRLRRTGCRATVIGWGPVGDVGMLSRNEKAAKSLEKMLGAPALRSDEVLDTLMAVAGSELENVHCLAADWQKLLRLPTMQDARWVSIAKMSAETKHADLSLADLLKGKSEAEGIDLLTSLVADEVAGIMGMPVSELNVLQPVSDLGMDSLMVVELAVALEERTGMKIPPVSLSGGATVRTIAERFYQMTGTSDEEQLIDVMAAKHGVELSGEVKEQILNKGNSK